MKLLFIAGHEFLGKQDNGGRQCSYRNYTVLQKCFGADNVSLCMLSNTIPSDELHHIKTFPTHHSRMEQVKNSLALRNGYNKKTELGLLEYIQLSDADILWFDFSITGSLVKKIQRHKKTVVFMHNIEKNYMWNKVRHSGPAYLLPYFSYSCNEKNIIDRADAIICLNDRDSRTLQKWYGKTADFLMPMTFTDTYDADRSKMTEEKPTGKSEKQLLFVGSLFPPNYDGIHWFVRNVMPKLQGFRLTVVGKDMEKKKSELTADNVNVVGTVDDLGKYYYEASAVVIPILYGDGMKIKTAEAMMYGKPIFATREALEGYDHSNIPGIWEYNDAPAFVEAIKKYFGNPRANGYCPAVRQLFLKKYETGSMEKRLKEFLERI